MKSMRHLRFWLLLAALAAPTAFSFGSPGKPTSRTGPTGNRITFLFGRRWVEIAHVKWDGRAEYPCPYTYLDAPHHSHSILLLGAIDSFGITVLAREGHRWQARRLLRQVAKRSSYSLSLET